LTRSLLLALALLAAAPALADERDPSADDGQAEPSIVHDDAETPPLARWGRGPFEVQDVYLLALNRLSPWARSPEIAGHLQLEVGLKGVWSNSYAFARNRLIVDGEIRQLITTLRFGLFDRVELGLWIPYEWRGGGTLDGFIEDFHKTFGLPDADRDEVSHDRYAAFGTEKNGEPFNYDHAGYGFNDLITEARVLLTEGTELLPAATATLRLRFPTGRGKFHLSDGVDVSLAIDASQRVGDWPLVFYTGLAYTYYADANVDDLKLTRHRLFFYVGGEWEFATYFSLVTHVWIETHRETKLWADASNLPLLAPRAKPDFGNWVTYVAAGFKFEPVEELVFELGILENIIDPETTADYTMMLNATYRF
jgi:hypothetical protein